MTVIITYILHVVLLGHCMCATCSDHYMLDLCVVCQVFVDSTSLQVCPLCYRNNSSVFNHEESEMLLETTKTSSMKLQLRLKVLKTEGCISQ